MTSPTLRRRIKCELIDRTRLLVRSRGHTATTNRPKSGQTEPGNRWSYGWLYIAGISLLVNDDGYTKIVRARVSKGQHSTILTCSGKAYRFGRNQAPINVLCETLEILKSEMVLDDLAAV